MGLADVLTTPHNPLTLPAAPSGFQAYNPVAWVANGRAALDSVVNAYILKPNSAAGIGGFVFDIEGATQLDAESEITDHYTEYNTFFNDHDAQRPLRVILRGYVGEVVLPGPQGVAGLLTTIQSKLNTLPGILGKYTPGALAKVQGVVNSAQNVVNQVDAAITKAQNIVSLIAPSSPAPSKQAKALNVLLSMKENAVVFTLTTPWGLLAKYDPTKKSGGPRSFVIQHLTTIQDENQRQITDISVTVKEVNFAQVYSSTSGQNQSVALQNNSGRAAFSKQALVNNGLTGGIPASVSTLRAAFA